MIQIGLTLILLLLPNVSCQLEDADNATSCFDCVDLLDPRTCGNSTTCTPGQVCYIEEALNLDGSIGYNMGCMPKTYCQASQQLIGVGRREEDGLTTCFRCCEDDDCNAAYCRDNCASAPCLNNGTCTTTGSNSYNCTCPPGLQGQQCQVDVDECASSPCLHGGTCQDQVNAFQCLCPPGRSGSVCQLDACTSDPCHNNATCQVQSANFTCQCQAGYTGLTCETEVDECASSPCLNGGSCQDLVAGFQCHCGLKWFGERCEVEKNGTVCLECQDLSHPALCRQYTLCQDKDSCFVDQHLDRDGSITFTMGCRSQRVCDLYAQIAGHQVGRAFHRITLCSHCCREDYCNREYCIGSLNGTACLTCSGVESPEECHNATVCGDDKKCYVEDGLNLLTGKKNHNFGCESKDLCKIIDGSSRRSPDYFTSTGVRRQDPFLSSCVRCCDGDYCNKGACRRDFCASNPCANGGKCSNEKNTFLCTCPPAFTGSTCSSSDPCFSSPCQNGGTCVAENGGKTFRCQCRNDTSGDHCDKVDFCKSSPCKNRGLCSLAADGQGPQCLCNTGFKGDLCDFQDHCYSSPCQHGGTCSDTGSGFQCTCRSGFIGDECQKVDYCSYSLCQNNGSCRHDTIGCFCPSDFVGPHCEISAHALDYLCKNGGTPITNSTCSCLRGFKGDTCETPDPCSSFPCKNGGSCRSHGKGIVCDCPPYYKGAVCEFAGLCTNSPCQNGGTCNEDRGRVTCNCAAGFSGKSCEVADPCVISPCQHNGTCMASGNSFVCHCLRAFNGTLCEVCNDQFVSLKDISCGADVDLIFLVEEAPSKDSKIVEDQIAFMHELWFGSHRAIAGGVEAAVVVYGDSARLLTNLTNNFITLQNALLATRNITNNGAGTSNLAQALDFSRLNVQTRWHSPTAIVALAHVTGDPGWEKILPAARDLKKDCIALNMVVVNSTLVSGQQSARDHSNSLAQSASLFGNTRDHIRFVPSYTALRNQSLPCVAH